MATRDTRDGQGQAAATAGGGEPRRVALQGSLDDVALWDMTVVETVCLGERDAVEFVAVGDDEVMLVTLGGDTFRQMPEKSAWQQAYRLLGWNVALGDTGGAVAVDAGMDVLRARHDGSWREFLSDLGFSRIVTCEVAGDGSGGTATCETCRSLSMFADDDPLLARVARAAYLSMSAWGRILAWTDPDDYEGDEGILRDAVDSFPCREGATDEERQVAYLRDLVGGCPWEVETAYLVVLPVAPMGFEDIMSALADEVGGRFDYFNGMSGRTPGHEPLDAALMSRYGLTATMTRVYLMHELESRISQAGGAHLARRVLRGLSEDMAAAAIPGYTELLERERSGEAIPQAGVYEEDVPF